MATCQGGERLARSHPRLLPLIPELDLLCEIKPGFRQGIIHVGWTTAFLDYAYHFTADLDTDWIGPVGYGAGYHHWLDYRQRNRVSARRLRLYAHSKSPALVT